MNDPRDDAKRLRLRDASLAPGLSQLGRDPSLGMPCLVAQTKSINAYPTAARSFFACAPTTVLGIEQEGGPATLTQGAATFLALNLGSVAPPVGTSVLVTFVDHRWVFRYDG